MRSDHRLLPPHQWLVNHTKSSTIMQVAKRFVSARLEATDAKAARDKDRQRAAGAAIRELKKVPLASDLL